MSDEFNGDDTIYMLANLHLANNEIKTFRVHNVDSTDGLATGTGRLVFMDGHLWLYSGEEWIQVSDSVILQQYQTRDEKDQPGGYAGLDENGEVLVQFIPTGNYSDRIPLLKGEVRDGQSIRFSDDDGGFVAFDISTLYTYKGSCSSLELDMITDPSVGDVWNLTDERTWRGSSYEAGTSWAWEGTEWEPLAGLLDLSDYQTVANMVQEITEGNSLNYPSTQAVIDYVETARTPVITDWADAADTNVPASTLVQSALDRKTDVTMAIPAWSEAETYTIGSTATHGQALYISVQSENTGHNPLLDTASEWWMPIQTEADLAVGTVRVVTHLIGNDTDTSYTVYHGFDNWNVFVTIRTNSDPSYIVDAVVRVVSANQINVDFTNPPGTEGYLVTVMAITDTASAAEGTMMVYTQADEATEWTVNHNWGTWALVQVYGTDGDQIMANIEQSADLNTVTVGFGTAKTGYVVLASAGSTDGVTTLSGIGNSQTMMLGDAHMVRLNEASGTWVVEHDKGRLVLVQIYDTDGDEIKAEVIQDLQTLNSVTIRFTREVSGTAVII